MSLSCYLVRLCIPFSFLLVSIFTSFAYVNANSFKYELKFMIKSNQFWLVMFFLQTINI